LIAVIATETGFPKIQESSILTPGATFYRIPCAGLPVVPSAAANYVQRRCLHLRSSSL